MDNRNSPPGSLVTKNWDPDKQDRWLARKASAVAQATDYLTTDKPNLESFYDFLVAARASIAKELTPKLVDEINTRREKSFHTIISNENGYSDYHESVNALFDDLFNNALPELRGEQTRNDPMLGNLLAVHTFACSPLSKKNETLLTSGYIDVQVKTNEANYSKIFKFYRENEVSGEKSELIVISHPSADAIKQAISEASNLFTQLQTNTHLSELQKLESIKKIAWHMLQAMPQARGSAAIGEMLIESLLKYHNIAFELETNLGLNTKSQVPSIDLIAMLSPTPEVFCSRVKLNASKELVATNEMVLNDNNRLAQMKYIDEVGLPSLRCYIDENDNLIDNKMKLGDKLKLVSLSARLPVAIELIESLLEKNISDPIYAASHEKLLNIEKQLSAVIIKHDLTEAIKHSNEANSNVSNPARLFTPSRMANTASEKKNDHTTAVNTMSGKRNT